MARRRPGELSDWPCPMLSQCTIALDSSQAVRYSPPMAKTTTRKSISDRIREEIEARGLTGYRVSKESGLSEPTVYRFLRGEGDPTIESLDKLLAFLGWDVGPVKPASKGGRR